MASGMLNDLEFESRLKEFGDNQLELIKFVARQQYASSKLQKKHETRITSIENGTRKSSSIAGAVSGSITGIIIGIINYFVHKG